MSSDDETKFVPSSLLKRLGCSNCALKSFGRCPYGFVDVDSGLPSGYCPELESLLLDLVVPGDSLSGLKQKYLLEVQRMQADDDLRSFRHLSSVRSELPSDASTVGELDTAIELHKMWWHRLSDSCIKGLGKVADRESRVVNGSSGDKITVQQLNVLLRDSRDHLKRIGDG